MERPELAKRRRWSDTANRSKASSNISHRIRFRRRRSIPARGVAARRQYRRPRAADSISRCTISSARISASRSTRCSASTRRATPVTSFTIGIADPDTTLRKVDEVGRSPDSQDQARHRHAGRADRNDRGDPRALRRNDSHRCQRGLGRRNGRDDFARARAVRHRVLRATGSRGTSGTVARDPRACDDTDRRGRRLAGRRRSCRASTAASTASTSSSRRPAASAARLR